ncbi:MAG: adenosylcobinamide-phosphate synthase CbiB [Firmicutes bacterium]|jgi:adenosylcobinamide-phosphate synthase|nr:adenosylcobinamide-phosphate synthase CbiB [Bacillota bacterium]
MLALTLGYLLDLLIADPRWLYHPVRFIGLLINFIEKSIRNAENKKYDKLKGFILLGIVMVLSYSIPYAFLRLCSIISPLLGIVVETIMVFQIMATKSLKTEVMKVYRKIKANDIDGARKFISYLVSRDTESLSFSDISKAAVETVSENIVDGVISPLFFLIIGGAPLGFLFKGVSTLDSMVGYKNDKYYDFGYASAKMDDLLNYIPARITGFLIVAVAFILGYDYKSSYRILLRDKSNHSSPNSAWSEAAVAGALGIQFGGRVPYFGKIFEKPTIGDNKKEVDAEDIIKVNRILYLSSISAMLISLWIKWILIR